MLFVFVSFLIVQAAGDSIILDNDCKRTTEACYMTLQVIKGDPAKDCAIFSTVERPCKVDNGSEDTTIDGSGSAIEITKTDKGVVVTWKGETTSGNGTSVTHLTAESIWNRLPEGGRRKREETGPVVNCTCSKANKKRRSVVSSIELKSTSGKISSADAGQNSCQNGYQAVGLYLLAIHDVVTMVPAASSQGCALQCTNDVRAAAPCIAFAFSAKATQENCVLLNKVPPLTPDGNMTLFTKC